MLFAFRFPSDFIPLPRHCFYTRPVYLPGFLVFPAERRLLLRFIFYAYRKGDATAEKIICVVVLIYFIIAARTRLVIGNN
jgi:hypothetical protein